MTTRAEGARTPDRERALAAVGDLVDVVDRLRSPGGSPWYAAQTRASLLRYVLEEAHEVVDAAEAGEASGEWAALTEELGDLLLQVVLQARLSAEEPGGAGALAEVAAGVAGKLRRRHPHVFAGAPALSAAEEERGWEPAKAAEKARASPLDGVPTALPALQRAQQLLERAERAGLPLPSAPTAPASGPPPLATAEQVGRHLLAVAAAARAAGVDAEAALRAAVRAQEAAWRAQGAPPQPEEAATPRR